MFDQDPLTGDKLKEEVHRIPEIRNPLIESFLYEKAIMMIVGDPKAGKSVISVEIAARLTCKSPLFGVLNIPEAKTVYYIQLERTKEEALERLKGMESEMEIDYNRLILDDKVVGIDMMNPTHQHKLIERIRHYCPFGPDVVILDPIYAGVSGGLSSDKEATAMCNASRMIQAEFGCVNILTHHTHKPRHGSDGKKINEDNRTYGSQWLNAHPTIQYELSKDEDNNACMKNKLDSWGVCLSKITTKYDAETYISKMVLDDEAKANDKIKLWFNLCATVGKEFYLREVAEYTKLGIRCVQKQFCSRPFKNMVVGNKSMGSKTLYTVL